MLAALHHAALPCLLLFLSNVVGCGELRRRFIATDESTQASHENTPPTHLLGTWITPCLDINGQGERKNLHLRSDRTFLTTFDKYGDDLNCAPFSFKGSLEYEGVYGSTANQLEFINQRAFFIVTDATWAQAFNASTECGRTTWQVNERIATEALTDCLLAEANQSLNTAFITPFVQSDSILRIGKTGLSTSSSSSEDLDPTPYHKGHFTLLGTWQLPCTKFSLAPLTTHSLSGTLRMDQEQGMRLSLDLYADEVCHSDQRLGLFDVTGIIHEVLPNQENFQISLTWDSAIQVTPFKQPLLQALQEHCDADLVLTKTQPVEGCQAISDTLPGKGPVRAQIDRYHIGFPFPVEFLGATQLLRQSFQ